MSPLRVAGRCSDHRERRLALDEHATQVLGEGVGGHAVEAVPPVGGEPPVEPQQPFLGGVQARPLRHPVRLDVDHRTVRRERLIGRGVVDGGLGRDLEVGAARGLVQREQSRCGAPPTGGVGHDRRARAARRLGAEHSAERRRPLLESRASGWRVLVGRQGLEEGGHALVVHGLPHSPTPPLIVPVRRRRRPVERMCPVEREVCSTRDRTPVFRRRRRSRRPALITPRSELRSVVGAVAQEVLLGDGRDLRSVVVPHVSGVEAACVGQRQRIEVDVVPLVHPGAPMQPDRVIQAHQHAQMGRGLGVPRRAEVGGVELQAVVQHRVVGEGTSGAHPQPPGDPPVEGFVALDHGAVDLEASAEGVGALDRASPPGRRHVARHRLEHLRRFLGDVEGADHREDGQALLDGRDATSGERAAVGVAVHLELDRELGAPSPQEVGVSRLRPSIRIDRRVGGVQRLGGDEAAEEVAFDVLADVDAEPVVADRLRADQGEEALDGVGRRGRAFRRRGGIGTRHEGRS